MGLGWTAALFAVATLGDEVPGAALRSAAPVARQSPDVRRPEPSLSAGRRWDGRLRTKKGSGAVLPSEPRQGRACCNHSSWPLSPNGRPSASATGSTMQIANSHKTRPGVSIPLPKLDAGRPCPGVYAQSSIHHFATVATPERLLSSKRCAIRTFWRKLTSLTAVDEAEVVHGEY